MSEERKSVLIASLGMGPGVVTSAVDALRNELGGNFSLEKVVTLSTVQLVKLPFLNLRPLTKKVIADLKGDPLDANTRRTIEILESLGIEIVNSIRDLNRRQEIFDKSETTE